MSSPEPPNDDTKVPENEGGQVPPVSPAYSTPRPDGMPSADNQE
jgi:hypothetical protein